MRYIINLTIVFDPETRLLKFRNNNQLTMALSKPAARLLAELIKNINIELSREELIKSVWEDYGFSPSNATLSNHISELRKAFEALGVSKGILITIPRKGFKMDAEIHPETKRPEDSPSVAEATLVAPADQPAVRHNTVSELIIADSKKPSHNRKVSVFFLVGVLLIIAIAAALTMNKDERRVLIGKQNKCLIYGMNEYVQSAEQLNRARKMLVNDKIDCTQTDLDIYYIEVRHDNELLRISFMATCTGNSNAGYKNCNSYKQVD